MRADARDGGADVQARDMHAPQVSFGYRLATALTGTAVILYLSLAPSDALPSVDLWDKAEHALAYAALTVAWILAFPNRIWFAAAGVFAFGVAVELLQASMHFGRVGHLYDVAANLIGIALGLAAMGWMRLMSRLR